MYFFTRKNDDFNEISIFSHLLSTMNHFSDHRNHKIIWYSYLERAKKRKLKMINE